MIAFQRIQDADGGVLVLRYAEADRVRSAILGKMGTPAAGIPYIAMCGYGLVVRLPGALTIGAAESRIEIAQAATRPGHSLAGIEVRTGHGRYISMELMNRLEILKSMVEQNPNDSFSRYGLAMEYANSGSLEKAVEEYEFLLGFNPDYAAAYYHAGQALEKLGQIDDARKMYQRGLDVTRRIGDAHTNSEIQAALDILG